MDPCIIDFGPYIQSGEFSTSEADMTSLGKSLAEGFSRGAVYVKNSGIDIGKVRRAQDKTDLFFAMPREIKQPYRFGHNLWRHGYGEIHAEWLGHDFGQTRDHKDSYNFRLFRESWPSGVDPDAEVPGFTETMRQAGMQFVPLSTWVLQCLALGLGLARDTFDVYLKSMHDNIPAGGNITQIKSTLNQPLDDSEDLSALARCGRHTDGSIITWDVLESVGGFQILQKDGNWVEVPPIPNTALLFAGSVLSRLLADKIPALIHQVVVTTREMARQRRRAFVLFFGPDTQAELKPVDGSDVYEPTTMAKILGEYYDDRLAKNA